MINSIKKIFKKSLSHEAVNAYWYKLPEEIGVKWSRDGKFIIGEINSEGHTFMTQGKGADDFIDMVNDAIFAVYEIPKEYYKILEQKKLKPGIEEYNRLLNNSISSGVIHFEKELVKV